MQLNQTPFHCTKHIQKKPYCPKMAYTYDCDVYTYVAYSMLYTMIVKSLTHCWDNFEQNAKILNQFDVDVLPEWVKEWK